MKKVDVTAKIGKDGTPVTIKYDLPENLEELVETYDGGEDGNPATGVVYNHAKSSIIVALQGKMRTLMDPEREGGPMDAEQVQAEIDGDGTEEHPAWRPGIRQPTKSATEKVREQLAKMDPELRKQILAELAGGGGSEDDEDAEEAEEKEEKPTPRRGGRRG